MKLRSKALIVVATLIVAACGDAEKMPEGLRLSTDSGGPQVKFDLEHWPFPDVPFPNDIATRLDSESPTGRRLNISELGATDAESEVRRLINQRSGWGILQPITVAFDEPLDIRNIQQRHHEPQPRFEDDAVYLINIDKSSPGYGNLRLLDLGRGNYPVTHKEPDDYFPNDPREMGTNLVFETVREEDENENGFLDWMEDTDDDGTWDEPNTLDPQGSPLERDQFLEFYERETNTLIMRPVRPLRAETTYAVVLTKALRGEDGNEVESPFPTINHTRQTEALAPLRELLPFKFPDRFGERLQAVQFAWSFTTGSPTKDMQALRAGLYGHGSFSWLQKKFPAELKLLHNAAKPDDDTPLTFDLAPVVDFIVPIAADQVGDEAAETVKEELREIDYIVSGSFMSPYLLADDDGLAEEGADATLNGTNPQDDDEHFRIDRSTGTAHYRPGEVTFSCAVPEEKEGRKQPFPVVIYSHAISSTRLEMLLVAGAFAQFGMATCGIDAAGHGIEIPDSFSENLDGLLETLGFPNLGPMIRHHRGRDIRNDGTPDPGENYFTSDMLHSRSMIKQTAIDQMQFIRILRSFGGGERWPDEIDEEDRYVKARKDIVAGWDQDGDGKGEIRGDFDGDGTPDFGGNRDYASFGTSLGAIQTGVLAGIEPTIRVAATNAGGGGLADIAARTTIGHVTNGVHLRLFGTMVIGEPIPGENEEESGTLVSFVLPNGIDDAKVPIAEVSGIEDGDQIVLRNLNREARPVVPEDEERSAARVRDGRFRVSIAADALSATARRAAKGFDPANDVRKDLLECTEDETCGEQDCPGGHYCSAEETCEPLRHCVARHDLEEVESEEVRKAIKRHTLDDENKKPIDFGDPLVIEIYGPEGDLKDRIERFRMDTIYQNVLYPKGERLAALDNGWGLKRQTPRFRRFLGLAHLLLESADPATYAPHYFERPLHFPYEDEPFRIGKTDMLVVGTVGDQTVPINTALTLARSAGILDSRGLEPAYKSTPNQFLVENYVYEGISWLDRFPSHPDALFDPDDLDRGMFVDPDAPENKAPNPDATNPLRATVETPGGTSALRLPYLETEGAHTFNAPRSGDPFDVPSFMTNQVGWYFATEGKKLRDDPCLQMMPLEDHCPFFDPKTFEGPMLGETAIADKPQ